MIQTPITTHNILLFVVSALILFGICGFVYIIMDILIRIMRQQFGMGKRCGIVCATLIIFLIGQVLFLMLYSVGP